jgi:Flp pilus assembly secretin CpaC
MSGSLRASVLAVTAGALLSVATTAYAQEIMKAGAVRGAKAARTALAAAQPPSPTYTDGGSPAATTDGRGTVSVMIDHAKVIRLPDGTQTVIVGNPMIADITVQRNGIAVVTGKSYGVTNLLALDGSGAMLAESFLSVQASTESVVVVQRGFERESYSCTPNCQPAILLGDSNKYFSEVGGQAGARNGMATQR